MILLLALACVSAAVVAVMVRVGAIDHPGARSSHERPTPKGGGVGIVAAVVLGVLIGPAFGLAVAPALRWVVLAGAALAAFSYSDDVRSFPAFAKLLAQVLVALVPVALGVVLPIGMFAWLPHGFAPLAAAAATLGLIVFSTNAINFIDGLNGLASGAVGLTAILAAGFIGGADRDFTAAGCLLLAAGILGFLPFNFPRARIFMGDVGSQFLGFSIVVIGIRAARLGPAPAVFIPMCLCGIWFDVLLTLARRAIAGQRLMQAHRGHLYQVAQRSFLTATMVTLLQWAMVVWGAWVWSVSLILGFGGSLRMAALLLVPQLVWLFRVAMAAQIARIGKW